jgi:hypothetical protein
MGGAWIHGNPRISPNPHKKLCSTRNKKFLHESGADFKAVSTLSTHSMNEKLLIWKNL